MKTELPEFPAILASIRMDRVRNTARIRRLTPAPIQPQTPPTTERR
jgi:hypothetical protein